MNENAKRNGGGSPPSRYSPFNERVKHLLAGRCPECLGPVAMRELCNEPPLVSFEYRCLDMDCGLKHCLAADSAPFDPGPDPSRAREQAVAFSAAA